MEDRIMCYVCQDFKINIGHETKWCPKNVCKTCGQKGHSKMGCMTGKQNLPMADEILLKILSYLDIKDLDQCAKVSKRVRQICLDDTLKYNEFLMNEWMTGKFPKVHALNTPLSVDMPQSKPWHKSFLSELRNCMVFRLILATLPKLKSIMAHYKETDLLKLMKKENRIQRICDYVKNMEKEYYNNDSDKETYFTHIEERVQKISRELEKKKNERKRQNEDNIENSNEGPNPKKLRRYDMIQQHHGSN